MADDRRESEAERRAARARWPIVRFAVADKRADDLSEVTTPVERVAMMWELAKSAWTVAGRSLPTYERSDVPARLFRAGTQRPADDDS